MSLRKQNCGMSANIKIISDLKNFIAQTATQVVLREVFTQSTTDFSRERKLGFERLVLLLINFFRKSYSLEIAEFYALIEASELMVSKSAFCQQRMKIKSLFFACLNEVLVQSFYTHCEHTVKRWKGMRLIAVDGSTAYLTDNDEMSAYFGTQGNQNREVPMGQIVSAFDVLNGISICAGLYPIRLAEQRVAQHWLAYYDPDMLLIYDRGYPGFTTIFLHQAKENPQPFLIRCPVGFTNEIKAFVNSTKKDIISTFKASRDASEELYKQGFVVPVNSTIEVRLIKVTLEDGTTEVLLTNLFDRQEYPQHLFKELYFKRWGIETNYNAVKNQLQLEAFSGQKVNTIMQDFYITFFLANLQQIIAGSCQEQITENCQHRKYHYKVNRNIAFGLLKNRIVDLFRTRNPEQILLQLQQLFSLHIEPIRSCRKFPRTKRARRIKGKYQALTNYKRAV